MQPARSRIYSLYVRQHRTPQRKLRSCTGTCCTRLCALQTNCSLRLATESRGYIRPVWVFGSRYLLLLTNGGTLCPWDTKTQGFTGMSDWLVQEKVTTLQWIPSAFRQFMRTVPDNTVFRDTRIVTMGGEPLTVREVKSFADISHGEATW